MLERGNNIVHRKDYKDRLAPWTWEDRGRVPEDEVREHYPVQSTSYAFSSENWRRPAEEIGDLMGLLKFFIRNDLAELVRTASFAVPNTWYAYDAAGQRVRKVWDKGSVVEERIYVGGYEVWRRKNGSGEVILANSADNAFGDGVVVNQGAIVFNPLADSTFVGAISGDGRIRKEGAQTLTLTPSVAAAGSLAGNLTLGLTSTAKAGTPRAANSSSIQPTPMPFDAMEQAMQWHKFRSNDPGLLWLRSLVAEAARRIDD